VSRARANTHGAEVRATPTTVGLSVPSRVYVRLALRRLVALRSSTRHVPDQADECAKTDGDGDGNEAKDEVAKRCCCGKQRRQVCSQTHCQHSDAQACVRKY